MQYVAEMLPADDVELDGWIAEAVRENDLIAFMYLVLAALSRDRPVDARHLARGAMLLPDPAWLGRVALRMYGDVAEHLLEAIHNTMLKPQCEALALYITAAWCQEHRGGVFPDKLIPAARALARREKTDLYDSRFCSR